jgi:hypothetical protein
MKIAVKKNFIPVQSFPYLVGKLAGKSQAGIFEQEQGFIISNSFTCVNFLLEYV